MEIANLIKEIVIALLWPLFAFYLAIIFKNELSLILRKLLHIDKINYKDFSAEFSNIKENSELITQEILSKKDEELQPKINEYISKYAIVEQTKQSILGYLLKYGMLNRVVAISLIANSIPDANNATKYLEIALSVLEKQDQIRLSGDTIIKK